MSAVYRWRVPDAPRTVELADPNDWDVFRYHKGPLEIGREVQLVPCKGEAVPQEWADQDFWDVDMPGPPCATQRARALLAPILGDDVQFIAARLGEAPCFIMNPLRMVSVDEATSVIVDDEDERLVPEPAFAPGALEGVHIFAIAQASVGYLYFTDAFVSRCDELGLRGLTGLELVWSEADGPVRRPWTAFMVHQQSTATIHADEDEDDDDEDEDVDDDDHWADADWHDEREGAFGPPVEAPLDAATRADLVEAAAEGVASLPTTRSDPEQPKLPPVPPRASPLASPTNATSAAAHTANVTVQRRAEESCGRA